MNAGVIVRLFITQKELNVMSGIDVVMLVGKHRDGSHASPNIIRQSIH